MFKKLFGSVFGGGSKPEDTGPSFSERRKAVRRPCKDLDVEVVAGRNQFDATVADIGAGGLLLSCSPQVAVKVKATLTLTHPDPAGGSAPVIQVKVAWTRVREADSTLLIGASYSDPKVMGSSWVKAEMESVGFRGHNLREQRKVVRAKKELPATLMLSGGEIPCNVKNIGLGGLLVQLEKPLRAGAKTTIRVADHPSLTGSTYTGSVRHLQHPFPSSPFFHGLSFESLTAEQEQALKDFISKEWQSAWDGGFHSTEAAPVELETVDQGGMSDEEYEAQKAAILAELSEEDDSGKSSA